MPERVHLTLGSKFERNDFTGFEVQPSARMAWTPGGGQTFWGSISRAVRTPSQAESDIVLKTGLSPLPIVGNPDMLAENLLAYEIGYRAEPFQKTSLDLTAFYNDYTRLRSEQINYTSVPVPPFFAPKNIEAANGLTGRSYGGEAELTYQPFEPWRLTGGFSYCQINIQGQDPANTATLLEGSSPRYQAFLRSSLDRREYYIRHHLALRRFP